jgi:lipopolysaccharide export system protein LptA
MMRMNRMAARALGLVAVLLAGGALAEKADSTKRVDINAASGSSDLVSGKTVAEGNVVLTRGTLVVNAGKLTSTEDAEGYVFATLDATPGKLATFRQKRDGGDLWVEGEAERIEYDGKNEVMKLLSKAKVTQLEGTKLTQQVAGAFIAYDSRKESVTVFNSPGGQSKVGGDRVQIIIEPKPRPAPPTPPGKPQ